MSVSDEDNVLLGDSEEQQEDDYPEGTASKKDEVKNKVNHVYVPNVSH